MTVVLHVGLPKTGTTTLQRHVFPSLPGVECYLNSGGTTPGAFLKTVRMLQECDSDEARKLALQHREILERKDKTPLLVSQENFTFPRKTAIDLAPLKLKNFFGDAHVVIVIRNQIDWLESYYFYHQAKVIRSGKVEDPQEFVAREASLGNAGVLCVTHYFDLWKSWAKQFGEENVTFIPYELLKNNASDFFLPFSKLLDVNAEQFVSAFRNAPRENTRLTWGEYVSGLNATRIRRQAPLLYRLLKRRRVRLHEGPFVADGVARFDFTPLLPTGTIDRWGEQNRLLSDALSLDLARFGYLGCHRAEQPVRASN